MTVFLQRPLPFMLLAFVGGILFVFEGPPANPWFLLIVAVLTIPLLSLSALYLQRGQPVIMIFLFFFAGMAVSLEAPKESILRPLAENRKRVVLEGTVVKTTRVMDDRVRLEARIHRVLRPVDRWVRDERIVLAVYGQGRFFHPGEKIRFPARLKCFRNFQNPGAYDYERAMGLRGLTCAASLSDGRYIVPMGRGKLGFPWDLLEKVRRPLRRFYRDQLSPETHALFRALILGETLYLSPALREPFNISGLGHLLAVSGLHVGLVAWLCFNLSLKLFSLSYRLALWTVIRRVAALFTLVPVLSYALLAGFQVSTRRAMMMVGAYLFSIVLKREKDVWSTLSFAAIVILALEPGSIFHVGFQLSFGAVIGILLLTPGIQKGLGNLVYQRLGDNHMVGKAAEYLIGLVAATCSALIFLLPITAFYFHRIPWVSIPANLTTVPLVGLWILPCGLLSAVCVFFSTTLASGILQLAEWGATCLLGLIGWWSDRPMAASWVVTPNLYEIALFYGLLFSVFFFRRYRWARVGLALVVGLIIVDLSCWIYWTQYNRSLRVTYLDVGQGNAALVRFPGRERMLIDGGGFGGNRFGGNRFDVGKMVIAPFLWRSKIKRIDTVVLSHPQSDHMNGLLFILKHFQPKAFWYNGMRVETPVFQELENILQRRGIRVRMPHELPETMQIGGVDVSCLYPLDGKGRGGCTRGGPGADLNNQSLVLRVGYEGIGFLFPGDLEEAGESAVVRQVGKRLQSDVLLVPHHGSRTSSTRPFLETVKPRWAVVSCGYGNYAGFPHGEALGRLGKAGCTILRIDREGAVEIEVFRGRVRVRRLMAFESP